MKEIRIKRRIVKIIDIDKNINKEVIRKKDRQRDKKIEKG